MSASSAAASNTDGVRPSITARMSFLPCKGSEARVPLRRAAAEPHPEHQDRDRKEVAEPGDGCERGDSERARGHERRGRPAGSAHAERSAHEGGCSGGAERTPRRAQEGFLPFADSEPDEKPEARAAPHGEDDARACRREESREQHPHAGAEAGGNAELVPLAHQAAPDSSRPITASPNSAARAPSTTRWSKVIET